MCKTKNDLHVILLTYENMLVHYPYFMVLAIYLISVTAVTSISSIIL